MSLTTETRTTINLTGLVTVADLASILEEMPPHGTVTFQDHAPDRPGVDAGYTSLTVTHRGRTT